MIATAMIVMTDKHDHIELDVSIHGPMWHSIFSAHQGDGLDGWIAFAMAAGGIDGDIDYCTPSAEALHTRLRLRVGWAEIGAGIERALLEMCGSLRIMECRRGTDSMFFEIMMSDDTTFPPQLQN